ncbi:MAG: hypothetical protein FIB01_08795, partial [Gemmatimonadetes bacterium]|nr:hypothetical protein [Gemmatimonadota bacterium]
MTTPPVVTVVSGDAQRAVVTLPLAQPVVVRVATSGTLTPGASVSFQVVRGGGSVDPASATSDGSGEARTQWTMGSTSGEGELSITATAAGRASVAVSARATADAAREALLTAVDGGSQQAIVGTAVPVAPLVRVRDSGGASLSGVRVSFTVTAGGGAVVGGNATTDAQGVARVERWTLGSAPGENSLRVSVEGAWAAPPLTLSATGVAPGGLALHPPRPYSVAVAAGGSIADSITGARFTFPAGGSGTLTVTRVADGRPVPYGAGATAVVEWSGTQEVQVALARAVGVEPNALLWGVPRQAMEGGRQAQWLALPRLRESGDSVIFGLTSATGLLDQAQPSPASEGAASFGFAGWKRNLLAAVRLAASTQQVAQLRALEAEAKAAVTNLRQIAPVQYWPRWDQSVATAPLTFSWNWPGFVSDCVSRYTSRISTGGPVIEFCASSVRGRGDHAAGHYVTELLGVAAQRNGNPVLDLAPGEIDASQAHDWGSSWWGFRKTITEDYAFFSQLVSGGGLIDGAAVDGSTPDFYFTRLADRRSPTGGSLGRQQPATVDYPTIEGFGVAMMAALHRASTSAHDFSTDPSAPSIVDVPALALPYDLLLSALARVPTTIDGLLSAIETELQGLSPTLLDDIPVALEAVGWSYHGSVRVLRPGSPPVPVTGATARVGIKGSNNKEYLLPAVGPSGTDGRITVPRLFPGKPYFVREN